MAESLYVRNGLIAGLAAGIVTAAITYAALPSVDEVIEATKTYMPGLAGEMDFEALRPILSIALKLSGLIALFALMIIGAIFGWVHEVIDKRLRAPAVSALTAGLILTALLVVPNIVLGGSWSKTLANTATGVTYIIVLVALAIKGKGRLGGSSQWWQG